jgi:hypothetical protein
VLGYVLKRSGLKPAALSEPHDERGEPSVQPPTGSTPPDYASSRQDIKSLREQKQPRSANEMAALVAYYLSHVAPEKERTDSVSVDDMKKYFIQAGFQLPQALSALLNNASAAGYFDRAGRGRFKLNPVGYNLVTHGLPSRAASGGSVSGRAAKRRTGRRKPARKR